MTAVLRAMGMTEVSISNKVGTHSCVVLTESLATFCPCSENLPEVKLRSSGLISQAEEISRLNNVDSMARLLFDNTYIELK